LKRVLLLLVACAACVRDLPPFVGAAGEEAGVDAGADALADAPQTNEAQADAGPCAAPGTTLAAIRIGDGNAQYVDGFALDDDGNPIASGSFEGTISFTNAPQPSYTATNASDGFVVSLLPNLTWRWGYIYGEDGNQFGTHVVAKGGSVLAASQFQGTIAHLDGDASVAPFGDGFDDAIVMRLDGKSGAPNAHVALIGPGVQQVNGLAFAATGAFMAGSNAGSFDWISPPMKVGAKGQFDAFIGQAIINGSFVSDWGGTADGGEPSNQEALGAAVDPATSNVFVVGDFQNSIDLGGRVLQAAGGAPDTDAFVAKLDGSGNVLGPPNSPGWPKRFGDAALQKATLVAIADASAVVVAGQFMGTINLGGSDLSSKGDYDVFVARWAADGTHVFSRSFGGPKADTPSALAIAPSGEIMLAGDFASSAIDLGGGALPNRGDVDAFIVKLRASDGAHVWSRAYGGAGDQHVTGVGVSPKTGEIFFGGYFDGTLDLGGGVSLVSAGATDGYVARACD
jgi:hypothetical protein